MARRYADLVEIVKNNYYKIIVHCTKVLRLSKTFVSMYKTPVRIIEEVIENKTLVKGQRNGDR